MSDKTVRCVQCSSEFSDEEIKGKNACPSCSETGIPMLIAQDIQVQINWHELRILSMWAENWERTMDKSRKPRTIAAITARLERQFSAFAPLSMAGEMRQLQEQFPSAEMYDGDGNTIVPKKTLH